MLFNTEVSAPALTLRKIPFTSPSLPRAVSLALLGEPPASYLRFPPAPPRQTSPSAFGCPSPAPLPSAAAWTPPRGTPPAALLGGQRQDAHPLLTPLPRAPALPQPRPRAPRAHEGGGNSAAEAGLESGSWVMTPKAKPRVGEGGRGGERGWHRWAGAFQHWHVLAAVPCIPLQSAPGAQQRSQPLCKLSC